MVPTQLIRLIALMERNAGGPDVSIGLIDGPVFSRHPPLNAEHLRQIGDLNRADEYLLGKGALRHISLDASDAEPDLEGVGYFSIDVVLRLCTVTETIRLYLAANFSLAKLRMQAHPGWLSLDTVS
jgi:hypothetical protein